MFVAAFVFVAYCVCSVSGAQRLASLTPPHIDHARRYLPSLITFTLVFADAGLLSIAGAIIGDTIPQLGSALPLRAVGLVGSSLLIAACGFASAALLAYARQRLAGSETDEAKPPVAELDRSLPTLGSPGLRRLAALNAMVAEDTGWVATWPTALASGIIGLLAAAGVVWSWRLSPGIGPDASGDLVAGGVLVLCAFPVLVLERIYANTDAGVLPEAAQLQWLLRAPLAALLGLGIATALLGTGFTWPIWIEQATGVLILLIAAELVLRAAATLFVPFPPARASPIRRREQHCPGHSPRLAEPKSGQCGRRKAVRHRSVAQLGNRLYRAGGGAGLLRVGIAGLGLDGRDGAAPRRARDLRALWSPRGGARTRFARPSPLAPRDHASCPARGAARGSGCRLRLRAGPGR